MRLPLQSEEKESSDEIGSRIEVNIRKEDMDSILFSAFNVVGSRSGPIRSGPAAETR